MNKTFRVTQRVFPIIVLVSIASWMTNCNQFYAFAPSEAESVLSTQPVFAPELVEETFDDGPSGGNPIAEETFDDGFFENPDIFDNPNPGNNGEGTGGEGTGGEGTGGEGTGGEGTGGEGTGGEGTGGEGTGGEGTGGEGQENVTEDVVNAPPFTQEECTGANQFRFRQEDGTYGSCQRCDVLDRDTGICEVAIVEPPRPNPQARVNNNNRVNRNIPITGNNINPFFMNNPGGNGWADIPGGEGDGSADPLMIDVEGKSYESQEDFATIWYSPDHFVTPGQLELTSPLEGTLFNLLGERETAVINGVERRLQKNTLYQVSWTQSKKYRFLALPNAQGFVMGINELFGDNTMGPDQDFSIDGFHALSKYDGMSADGTKIVAPADGFIDKEDPIFDQLRVWVDKNDDGNANTRAETDPNLSTNELETLSAHGIKAIHVIPNKNFYERDVYGNEIVFKAVVQFEDELRKGIAFDLWLEFKPELAQDQ